jgi:hypothetical protein
MTPAVRRTSGNRQEELEARPGAGNESSRYTFSLVLQHANRRRH